MSGVERVLLHLAGTTAHAVEEALNALVPGAVARGGVAAVGEGDDVLEGIAAPALACDVEYVDGVTGGNVMVMPLLAARRLAVAMSGGDPHAVVDGPPDLEASEHDAVAEALRCVMAAAARATSSLIGEEVELAPPVTRVLAGGAELNEAVGTAPHLASVALIVFGIECRLVQLVPNAFMVRITRALEDHVDRGQGFSVGEALLSVDVRVWAELGRARIPTGRLVELPGGAIVELDRDADDAIDLYVDGMRYATGRLVVCDGDTWGLRIEEVVASAGLGRQATA